MTKETFKRKPKAHSTDSTRPTITGIMARNGIPQTYKPIDNTPEERTGINQALFFNKLPENTRSASEDKATDPEIDFNP